MPNSSICHQGVWCLQSSNLSHLLAANHLTSLLSQCMLHRSDKINWCKIFDKFNGMLSNLPFCFPSLTTPWICSLGKRSWKCFETCVLISIHPSYIHPSTHWDFTHSILTYLYKREQTDQKGLESRFPIALLLEWEPPSSS